MEEGVDASVETVRVSCGEIVPAHEARTHISVGVDVLEADSKLPKAIGLRTVGGLEVEDFVKTRTGIAEAPEVRCLVQFATAPALLRIRKPLVTSTSSSLTSLALSSDLHYPCGGIPPSVDALAAQRGARAASSARSQGAHPQQLGRGADGWTVEL